MKNIPIKFRFLSIIWLLVIFWGIFIRLFQLNSFPLGLMQDEALAGYDAYSILLTGKDHHGHFLPITFQAFNDWIAHSFVYQLIPFVKILGLSLYYLFSG